ncbi:hypothetical protein [Cryptosporangium aurantiacum]|uniref:Uncharacterized protein n=1 Tax=Cryptosporangium aurantiacum TaxID=134849 RepID=A0A1M7TU63_9ACTN|nr:hypothetical protein [Cryptosporangium aurantiacum]SHN74240.1 hypothetical protein SAMN05443668_10742 [Cryptosporangium aurantiacum]
MVDHRLRAWAALTFAVGEILLRASWLAGSRWGYTACDRTDLPADPSGGCGADRVTAVPFGVGWGALLACALLAGCAVLALWRPGRVAAAAAWAGAAGLVLASFPLHLLFELPAAIGGRPEDWRDLFGRLALLGGGVLFGELAAALTPVAPGGTPTLRPVPRWARITAYTAAVLPWIGWAVPHALWLLGVPFGISSAMVDDIDAELSSTAGIAITAIPPLAGLLVLGLAQRWGQIVPEWVPHLGGRAVPRLLALVPAGTVAAALVAYGLLSTAALIAALADGSSSGADVLSGWAATGTLVVFVAWGGTLGATAVGYHVATRTPRPAAATPAVIPEVGRGRLSSSRPDAPPEVPATVPPSPGAT